MSAHDEQQRGGYRRVKLVGSGSFGKAWLVQRRGSCAQYVLKEIAVRLMDEDARRAAVNEVLVLRQLRHPYIVRYRDAFCCDGTLCICMEYAAGGDLATRIKQRRERGELFPESKVLDYFTQLTLALAYLHRKNILHRDLKTQNVFLSVRDHVKLGDFGISKVLTDTQQHATTLVGTPFYLSPEICMGLPYDHKSDAWALGCVLHELLTLQHAFHAHSISSLMARIMSGHYPEPSIETYSAAVRRLVRHLLDVKPEARWDTAVLLQQQVLQLHVLKYAKAPDMDHVAVGPHLRAVLTRKAAKCKRTVEGTCLRVDSRKGLDVGEPQDEKRERCRARQLERQAQHKRKEQRSLQCQEQRKNEQLRQEQAGQDEGEMQTGARGEQKAQEIQQQLHQHHLPEQQQLQEEQERQEKEQELQQQAGKEQEQQRIDVAVRSNPAEAPKRKKETARFMLGQATLHLQGVSARDSVYTRLEALRQFLETRLGEERLAKAYAQVQEQWATQSDGCKLEKAAQGQGPIPGQQGPANSSMQAISESPPIASSPVARAQKPGQDGPVSHHRLSRLQQALYFSDPILQVYSPLIVQLVHCEASLASHQCSP